MKNRDTHTLKKLTGGTAGLLTLLAILVALNVIFNNIKIRIDLTEEKLYSLSSGTKSILSQLDQPVTLKFFFSKSNPQAPVHMKNFASQVEDLLHEYTIASKGMVIIEQYDPKPDSDDEEWAHRYGVAGQPLNMMGTPFFFGLVAVSGEIDATIPFIDPRGEQLLEYTITRLINRISHPEQPSVGVMSSLPVLGEQNRFHMPNQAPPTPPWIAFQELQNYYHVHNIRIDTKEISKIIDTLIIVHPKEVSDATLFAIDQYLLNGGHVIAFLDPFCNVDAPPPGQQGMMQMRHDNSSNLEKLLNSWGVGFEQRKVVADIGSASRVQMGNRAEDSPLWLTLRGETINDSDILTSQLEILMTPFAGAFTDNTSDDLAFTPLVKSLKNAVMVSSMTARYGTPAIRAELHQPGAARNIAIRVTGKFKTAFSDGDPAENTDVAANDSKTEEENLPSKHKSLQEGESSLILIADADMIYDQFCVRALNMMGQTVHQPFNDNINFFANAVEQMVGSADLIAIRSRGKFNRPFKEVIAREEKAQRLWHTREEELQTRLRDIQRKMSALQSQKDESQRFIINVAQKKEVDNFRKEVLRIQKELREVRKNLRKDIEDLGVTVKLINITLMPLAVCITGLCYGLYRRKKR